MFAEVWYFIQVLGSPRPKSEGLGQTVHKTPNFCPQNRF